MPWWDLEKNELQRDLKIRDDMKQMTGDVTKAITVAKAKLGVNGWIRTTASSEFKNLLLDLLKPVQEN